MTDRSKDQAGWNAEAWGEPLVALSQRHAALVVGYGSDLRRDDGAGRWVAEAIGSIGMYGVRTLAVHQLTPELAAQLAEVHTAIFVDAQRGGSGVLVHPLHDVGPLRMNHTSSPEWLLELSESVYGHRPQAWIVSVPAHELALGEGLSAHTQRACYAAIQEVQRLIHAAWA
ncbi:MAG: hypothetical protein RLZZ387_1977 [Chloroflexota bacterium]